MGLQNPQRFLIWTCVALTLHLEALTPRRSLATPEQEGEGGGGVGGGGGGGGGGGVAAGGSSSWGRREHGPRRDI